MSSTSSLTRLNGAILPLAALLCLGTGTPASRAGGNLRLEMARVADNVAKLLEGKGTNSIAVGAFSAPAHVNGSAGPSISKVLAEELQKKSITVTTRAEYEIKGDYNDVIDKQTKLLAARIRARVEDRSGNVLVNLEAGVFGDADLAALFGTTAELPPYADEKARDKELQKAIDKPKVTITDYRASASPQSPYAVEILVGRSGGKTFVPRPAHEEDGCAFVPIKRGEAYYVKLINNSNYEAAANLTVDGLSMFVFSKIREKGQPKYSVVIIPPKSSVIVKGWHIDNEYSDEFLVTEYAKSAAAQLRSTAPTGLITACFSASWPEGAAPPPDEPPNPKEHSRSADATGRGQTVGAKYQEVKRNFGVVRSTVTVRYTK
jgi:hypothetical protein